MQVRTSIAATPATVGGRPGHDESWPLPGRHLRRVETAAGPAAMILLRGIHGQIHAIAWHPAQLERPAGRWTLVRCPCGVEAQCERLMTVGATSRIGRRRSTARRSSLACGASGVRLEPHAEPATSVLVASETAHGVGVRGGHDSSCPGRPPTVAGVAAIEVRTCIEPPICAVVSAMSVPPTNALGERPSRDSDAELGNRADVFGTGHYPHRTSRGGHGPSPSAFAGTAVARD